MRILIIGGTGFIGKHLIGYLKEFHELILFHRGHQVVPKACQSVIGDRKELWQYKAQFRDLKPDIVIDLIAYFAQDAWDLIHTFKQITKKIILISSGDVYRGYEIFKDKAGIPIQKPSQESDDLRTRLYPYRGIDQQNFLLEHYEKILVEQILMSQNEFDTTILRLGALFGEYDKQRKLSEYIMPMIEKEPEITVTQEKANWKWSRGYIKNVVQGIKAVIDQEEASRNQIFNIADKKTLTELQLIETLRSITGWNGTIRLVDEAQDQYNYQQNLILNTDKIRTKLAYTEKYTLEVGLKNTFEYLLRQG